MRITTPMVASHGFFIAPKNSPRAVPVGWSARGMEETEGRVVRTAMGRCVASWWARVNVGSRKGQDQEYEVRARLRACVQAARERVRRVRLPISVRVVPLIRLVCALTSPGVAPDQSKLRSDAETGARFVRTTGASIRSRDGDSLAAAHAVTAVQALVARAVSNRDRAAHFARWRIALAVAHRVGQHGFKPPA